MNITLIGYIVVLLIILLGTIYFLYRRFKKRKTKKIEEEKSVDSIEEMFNRGEILLPSKKEDFENFEEFRRKTFDNDLIQDKLNEIDVNSEYERQ